MHSGVLRGAVLVLRWLLDGLQYDCGVLWAGRFGHDDEGTLQRPHVIRKSLSELLPLCCTEPLRKKLPQFFLRATPVEIRFQCCSDVETRRLLAPLDDNRCR